jgi:hypothetical protein
MTIAMHPPNTYGVKRTRAVAWNVLQTMSVVKMFAKQGSASPEKVRRAKLIRRLQIWGARNMAIAMHPANTYGVTGIRAVVWNVFRTPVVHPTVFATKVLASPVKGHYRSSKHHS